MLALNARFLDNPATAIYSGTSKNFLQVIEADAALEAFSVDEGDSG